MNILFVPDCYYLSNKIFLAIAKQAKNHTNIYFDTKDGFNTNTYNNNAEEIIETFDRIFIRSEYKPIKLQMKDIGMFLKRILTFQDYKKELHEQLEQLKPDIIVVTTDMSGLVNRMCNHWAAKNNVPYVVIQSAFIEGMASTFEYRAKNKIGYLLVNRLLNIPLFRRQEIYGCEKKSNYLFLWGSDFKKRYAGTCIEKNIRLVGNPVFDKIEPRIDCYRYFKVKPIALLCPSMFFERVIGEKNGLKIQKMYQDIIKQNPNVHFIVKVHPRETEEQYNELLKNCGNNYCVMKYADLYELFKVADVQISLASYSSFEAIVVGVPVILLGNHMLEFPFVQFNHKAIFSVDNIEEFNWALDLCLSKSYAKKFKKLRIDYLSTKLKYIGSSASHIIENIEDIVNETN